MARRYMCLDNKLTFEPSTVAVSGLKKVSQEVHQGWRTRENCQTDCSPRQETTLTLKT